MKVIRDMRSRTLNQSLLRCLALSASLMVPLARAGTTGVDLGTAAPPATLGGYTLTPFGADASPLDSTLSSLPAPFGGAVTFSTPVRHDQVGNPNGFYATWSHGYSGAVYDTTADINDITLTLPAQTTAFYFYAEPNQWADFSITAETQDGATVTSTVAGNGGASGFGFYAEPGAFLSSIHVTTTDLDFALGEFGIAGVHIAGVPEGGSTLLLMLLSVMGLGAVRSALRTRGVTACRRSIMAISAALLLCFAGWSQSAQAGAVRGLAGFTANHYGPNDDGSYPTVGGNNGTPPGTPTLVPIGFTIDFYGVVVNSVYLNNNGNVTLDAPLATFTPFGLTATSRKIIAAFFADVDTRAGNTVTFGNDTVDGHPAFGVNWAGVGAGVGYFNQHIDKLNSFQLILISRNDIGSEDFDIEFNYDQVQWETGDASGGVNGLGGSSAHVGYSNGSGVDGTFSEFPGSGVPGSFIDGGPQSLVAHAFNSGLAGRYVFFVRNGNVIPPPEPEVPPILELNPSTQSLTEGQQATVTAHLFLPASAPVPGPVAGAQVSFTVTSGPNAGLQATGTTSASGEVSFTYTGSGGPGQDVIGASSNPSGTQAISATPATVTWAALPVENPPTITRVIAGNRGYYKLTASSEDFDDPNDLKIFIADTASGQVAGPFASGLVFRIVKRAVPSVGPGTATAAVTIAVVGDAVAYAVEPPARCRSAYHPKRDVTHIRDAPLLRFLWGGSG